MLAVDSHPDYVAKGGSLGLIDYFSRSFPIPNLPMSSHILASSYLPPSFHLFFCFSSAWQGFCAPSAHPLLLMRERHPRSRDPSPPQSGFLAAQLS